MKKIENIEKIKVVELFAGVGGFRIGLEKASDRYDFVWANQWEPGKKDQFAFDCYTSHFGKSPNHVNKDIATVIDEVPEHDLLVGGFPCQDYSVARTGAKGIEGKKGVLWWSIDAILSKRNPKYVLLENVDRLLKSPSNQRGRDFGIILECFKQKGYDVEWMMINAADYGMAQKRRRTFIFAHKSKDRQEIQFDRNELDNNHFFTQEFKIDEIKNLKMIDLNKYEDVLDLSDNYKDGKFLNIGKMKNGKVLMADYTPNYNGECVQLGQLLESNVESKYYLNESQIEKAKATKQSKKLERVSKDGFKYNYSEGSMCFPDYLNKPARTMLTSEATLNRSTHYIGDKIGIRVLSPVEAERINGFPDNWTNTGMTERNRYFCMGNALVVNLIEKFGNILNKYYN